MASFQDVKDIPSQPTLPPPQLFHILPALHEILARIDHASAAPGILTDSDNDLGTAYTSLQPLDPKDLSGAIAPLKSQIRKGLRELEKLPDMDRSVLEQEEEIAELETKIYEQRTVLSGLATENLGS